MALRAPNIWRLIALVGTICYPLIVYFFHGKVSPISFVIFGLVLILFRLITARRGTNKIWNAALCIAVVGLGLLFSVDSGLAVKAYPVIISLSFAAVFGLSLIHPPTIIERIARITEPDLPPEGVAYTRKVTIVWTVFLIGNAAISASTALWGTLEQWTLWNSLLSYIAMGVLFAVEYLVRRTVRK